MKRRDLATVVIAAGLIGGVWLGASRGGVGSRAPAKLDTSGAHATDLWPTSTAWAWDVEPVGAKRWVGVCVRTTESKLPANTSPTIAVPPELPRKGAEQHTGWTLERDEALAGRVTCQLIDLGEAGLGEVVGKQPLRLLVRLRFGGSVLNMPGQHTILAGEWFAGASMAQPQWSGDELHLFTVFTQTGDTLFAHHVVVQQRED